MTVIDQLPIVAQARLPASYEGAKKALAECASIDECKDWADKAAALASYGKQANDDELFKLAMRIKARAIRRAGELLQEIEPQQGGDRKSTGGQPPIDRTSAATEAGLSEHQRKTALRVANVPADLFEQQIESETPPTIGALAKQGTAKQPESLIDLGERTPEEFKAATRLIGLIGNIERDGFAMDIAVAARGLAQDEAAEMLDQIQRIRNWLDHVFEGVAACP